jgi:4-hydroxybenzoate polyprenyltransferase
VTSSATLAVRMLRYRVATMIWLFMLLGAAGRVGLERLSWRHAVAALALGASYVAATTENDVADEQIDLVNHPRDRGRPLVTGEATARDLLVLHRLAAAASLAAAAALGWPAAVLVAASLLVSRAYSRQPLRLSYRTWLAHPALGIAYVAIPYGLGLAVVHARPRPADALLAGGLFCLFLARIVLKDFRDREGDGRFGKPTLLLRHGKRATCLVSGGALAAGDVLLLVALHPPVAVASLLEVYVAGAAAMLVSLARASDAHEEQVAIGIGAKAGNGILVSVLAWLALHAHGAPSGTSIAFLALLTVLFGSSYALLVARPEQAVIGYKG